MAQVSGLGVILTEKMVLAKARAERYGQTMHVKVHLCSVCVSQACLRHSTAAACHCSLSDVKVLNCWGQDLADVTVLTQMPNVQVLSLSVNKIGSLRCKLCPFPGRHLLTGASADRCICQSCDA